MKLGHAFWLTAAFSLVWIGEAVGADAVLHGKMNDALTGRQTPCTVRITDANGRVVVESASFSDGFRSSGEFAKRLPAGLTRIRITRGFETKAINHEVNLVAGETKALWDSVWAKMAHVRSVPHTSNV